jgi:glycosyltransferase involved in cell wall biosynthesis
MKNPTQNHRKTVGVFMPFLSGNRGGPDVTAMWLIQALCAHYDVTLVTTSQFDLDFFNKFAASELKRDQFHIRQIPLLPAPPSMPMSAIQSSLFQRSARSCAAEFDLCLNAMNLLDLGVHAVHFIADLDWLAAIDPDSQSAPAPAKPRSASALRRLYHSLSASALNPSGRDLLREDVLVSNSEWVASSLRAMGIESPVIYPPVPWVSREKDWETRRNDFVWIGRIDPSKKLEDAINIVAALRNAGTDCAIHIVGVAADQAYLNSIRTLAKRMGDWVILEGPIYGEDKIDFLTQFRYAIHTRADEPFGITLVELMKAGCIPFAPNACGSAEILNHPALLFSSRDQAVAQICELFSNPDLSQSVRSFLKHRAESFATDEFCKSVISLVSAILERASSESEIHSSQTRVNSEQIDSYGI